MGHHLRKDNICLNCGAIVHERFCTRCGQENIETKESFGHVLRHFFEDFTHYDSKFFTTIKELLIRPGFLTAEYLSGRRQSYLHPIRMYLFISFIYFLVVFSFLSDVGGGLEESMMKKASYNDRMLIADSVERMIAEEKRDTVHANVTVPLLHRVLSVVYLPSDTLQKDFNFTLFADVDYKFLKRYDSTQRVLPADQRDAGLKPWLYRRWQQSLERYGEGSVILIINKTNNFFPKMMFLLLPVFALVLKLLHSRKKYFYAQHAIFTLHFHSAVFLLFLVAGIIIYFTPSIRMYINIAQLALAALYLIIALRRVYQSPLWLTILKTGFIGVLYLVFLMIGVMTVSLTALL